VRALTEATAAAQAAGLNAEQIRLAMEAVAELADGDDEEEA
jgi:hypothetical protein